MGLALKNILFLLLAPGTVAVALPWLLAEDRSPPGGINLGAALVLLAT